MRRCLLVLLVLTALVGACSKGPEDRAQSAREILLAAPARTLAARTSRVAVSVVLEGSDANTSFSGDGAFDFGRRRGQLAMDLTALGIKGGEQSQILFAGDVVFMKLPLDLPQLEKRPWIKIDVATLGRTTGLNLDSVRQLKSNDPTAALNYLRGVEGEVRRTGSEQVRGDATTRYSAVIDLDRAASEAPATDKADVRRVIEELGTSRLPAEVWIDGSGRLRRLRYRVDLATLGGAEPLAGTVTASFELFQFGVPVAVEEPPADQVTDLGDLIRADRGK